MIVIMIGKFIDQLVAVADKQFQLDQGKYLFHRNDPVRMIFIVNEGLIELTRFQQHGTAIVLQQANKRTLLAEASIYSEQYHCDAIATLPSVVYGVPKDKFFKQMNDTEFVSAWTKHLAEETQLARYRSEILSLKTVAERLDAWLDWHENQLPAKGQWKDLALQIGVSAEALYREIAKRKGSFKFDNRL